ncbi:MAG: hypothetical protein NZ891_00580, partial [bacterium]|nr:hypothetical protein [bacterium]MDW8163227.1 hypothetical protein [Candidatus Omnitrophota bacterium]
EQKLEDITNSETSVSSLISSNIVKMKKNGEIIEIDEVNGKILSLTQVLKLLPNFPEKVVSGKKWKQRMPAFELPGIQMCALEFNYLYLKKGNTSSIELTGIHTIKEKKKNKDITITFEGKNNSKGNFNFDEIEGKIKDFKGDFLIDLDAKFEVPPSPDVKGKIAETYTVKLNLKLNILLAELL